MNTRHDQLLLISRRVEQANDKITEILSTLDWTRQELIQWQKKRKALLTCPFNKRHQVPQISMDSHYRRCYLKSQGLCYDKRKKYRKKSASNVNKDANCNQ